MSTRKVPFNGQMRDATIVDFEVEKESFSTYILHDGSSIKIKPVLVEVFRIDGEYAPNGDPIYGFNVQQIAAINANESLRRKD